jgi:hypothetical protein
MRPGLAGRLPGRLERGRIAALARMLSACTIYRQAGRGTPDPVTGHAPITWTVVHQGPMRLGGIPRGASQEVTIAIPGGTKVIAKRTAHLPHDVAGLREGDLLHVTTGDRADTWWWLGDATGADQQTALRLPAAETEKPEDL